VLMRCGCSGSNTRRRAASGPHAARSIGIREAVRIARGEQIVGPGVRITTTWLGVVWEGVPAPVWWWYGQRRENPGCGCIAELKAFERDGGFDATGAVAHALRRIVGAVSGDATRVRAGGSGSHPRTLLRSAQRPLGRLWRLPVGAAASRGGRWFGRRRSVTGL